MLFSRLSALALACASTVLAAADTTGFTVTLNGIPYFLPPKPVGTVGKGSGLPKTPFGSFTPVTVVTITAGSYGHSQFTSTVSSFDSSDDVYQPAFGNCEYCP